MAGKRRTQPPRPPAGPPASLKARAAAVLAGSGKVGLIICGNHAIRAAVAAMQSTFRRILAEGGIAGVESDIAAVMEIFALQGDEHMRQLEKAYLR
jgi:2-methylisocitrate lyase-like PEP mutase family enzyme